MDSAGRAVPLAPGGGRHVTPKRVLHSNFGCCIGTIENTGSADSCSGAGGTWVDQSFFIDFGLPDWSGSASSDLAAVVAGIQAGFALVQTGSGLSGWMLVANNGAGPIDWNLLINPMPTPNSSRNASGGNPGSASQDIHCPPGSVPLNANVCGSAPDPTKIRRWAKWYLCGSSPAKNVRNWAVEGAGKGALVGGVTGFLAGGPVGAVVMGAADSGVGTFAGLFSGSVASIACGFAGAYGPPPYVGSAF
jgi:hypothetical protein